MNKMKKNLIIVTHQIKKKGILYNNKAFAKNCLNNKKSKRDITHYLLKSIYNGISNLILL